MCAVLGDVCGAGALQARPHQLCPLGNHHHLRGDNQEVRLFPTDMSTSVNVMLCECECECVDV